MLLLQNECFKKNSAFYLDLEKIAGLELKIAIFSKTAIFAISKKYIYIYGMIWRIGSSVFEILEHAH